MEDADEPFSDDNSATNNTSSSATYSSPTFSQSNGRSYVPHLRFSDPLPHGTPPREIREFDFGTSFSTATSEMSLYQSALDLQDVNRVDPRGSVHSEHVPLSTNDALQDIVEEDPIDAASITPLGRAPPRMISRDDELYFRDGVRRIDFVLAYSAVDGHNSERHAQLRRIFEVNLMADGLELEHEVEEGKLVNFVKIYASWEVLRRYAEIMKLKMPMRELEAKDQSSGNILIDEVQSMYQKCTRCLRLDESKFPPQDKRFTYEYSREKEYLFDIPPERDEFFSPSNRSLVVDFILKRTSFSREKAHDISTGIVKLLAEGVYTACYRLHEGDLKVSGPSSPRGLLKTEWASLKKIHKQQPLDHIRDYFGVMFALYFAWLGFYTYMLIPASIVGLICFLYGCITIYNFVPSNDICTIGSNLTMCPVCDNFCEYWRLNQTCIHSRITYLVDNNATVIFAVFMSLWSTMFLEMWKRYSATITYRWDLTGFDQGEEHPRPEYLARLAKRRKEISHVIATSTEPKLSFWKVRVPACIMSVSVVLLLITVALAAVLGVIFYRMSFMTALVLSYEKGMDDQVISRNAPLITTATAALINLVCILILNQIYGRIAEMLTEVEMHRTQTEYDDSLTLKMFLLQFVNYYASIFYIAFFKGKIIGHPGNYMRLFGYRQEECGPGGCLMELCIQLSIIMIGKQALNSIIEMLMPKFWKFYQAVKNKISTTKKYTPKYPWEKDYYLIQWQSLGLFWEYLEMVLQFGFVTIFVAAFPLAPLFALMNNAFEMRLDATKIISYYRRPTPHRVKNIGIWFQILDGIGKLAVITNAFIIAFTSQYIPRMVYMHFVSSDGSLNGYVNYSLSYFNVTDYSPKYRPKETNETVEICRYEDYREPPWSNKVPYDYTPYFWHVLAARLAFVVVFENFIVLTTTLIRWIVPDIPYKLKDTMRKESYVINEMIVQYEFLRAKGHLQNQVYSAKTLADQASRYMERQQEDFEDTPNNVRKRPATESLV